MRFVCVTVIDNLVMAEFVPENMLVSPTGRTNQYAALGMMEARVGVEPTHEGFADLSLTTWVPHLGWPHFYTTRMDEGGT